MGGGQVPGILGKRKKAGIVSNQGSHGNIFLDILFPHSVFGPMGAHLKIAYQSAQKKIKLVRKKNEDELKLLIKIYGGRVCRAQPRKNGKLEPYASHKKKGKRTFQFDLYVKDRNAFFGSETDYWDYLKIARSELEADEKLRRVVDVPNKGTGWERAQDVYYAWVRKAYEIKLKELNKSHVNIPKLILSGKSSKLKTALKRVKNDYGKSFAYGGFNPRPIRQKGLRLGTLSDHGLGTAIDIDVNNNPLIYAKPWNAILTFTGKTLNKPTRETQWKNNPGKLYDEIKAISDAFVTKLKKEKEDTIAAAKKVAEAPGATDKQKKEYEKITKDPLQAIINANPTLKVIGKGFLNKHKNGFLSLPRKLVIELQDEGFLWGATFEKLDLHHFQL